MSFGERVAGASGLALLIVMFLPWYGPPAAVAGIGDVTDRSAWQAFSVIDVLLLVVSVTAVGVAFARASGAMRASPGMLLTAGGGLAIALICFRLVSPPDPAGVGDTLDFSRKVGIFLGLIAAVGVTYGGYRATKERPTEEPPRRHPPRRAPPGRMQPPPGRLPPR